jgi:hypothetical protein
MAQKVRFSHHMERRPTEVIHLLQCLLGRGADFDNPTGVGDCIQNRFVVFPQMNLLEQRQPACVCVCRTFAHDVSGPPHHSIPTQRSAAQQRSAAAQRSAAQGKARQGKAMEKEAQRTQSRGLRRSETAAQQNGLFLSFSYVCPEPVLVK